MGSELLPYEESASVLLWAFPSLLGWPREIHWLFSPVVGNSKYPGDLWGLDTSGNLLVVETKLDKPGRSTNPFEDFVRFVAGGMVSQHCPAEVLERRWRKLLKRELEFLGTASPFFSASCPTSGTYPGVVPYSRHRKAIWYWQDLYRQHIAPQLESGTHERAVARALRCRRAVADPDPVLIGLVAVTRNESPALSRAGADGARKLRAAVGSDRVHLRAVCPKHSGSEVAVRSWSLACPGD